MNCSAPSYKRARPLCGTFFRLELTTADEAGASAACTEAFALAERLEASLSKFREESELSQVNHWPAGREDEISPDLALLLERAFTLHELSRGAFNPFFPAFHERAPFTLSGRRLLKHNQTSLDLGGFAKGWIADDVAKFLENRFPGSPGLVNAGGDLRFFGDAGPYEVHLRVGSAEAAFTVPLRSPLPAIATSTVGGWFSSAQYAGGAPAGHSVSALAPSAASADACTKIGLFAPTPVALSCAKALGAQILTFDQRGQLLQNIGSHETLGPL